MEFILNCVISFFDVYIIFRYMTIFFDNHYVDRKLVRIAYITRFLLSVGISYVELYPLVGTLITWLSIFLISLCYTAKFSKRIISSIIIYMCSFMAEAIVAMIIGLSGFNLFEKVEQSSIVLSVIIEFIFWIISLVVQKFSHVKKSTPIPKTFVMAIIIIPISMMSMEIVIFSQNILNNVMAGVSVICLIASIFILIYLYDSLSRMFNERARAIVALREKDYYHEQAALLKEKYEELRHYRHDMKNRMIVVEQMIKDKQYDMVLKYTEELSEKFGQISLYCNTGNIALDSIINYKVAKMVESNIMVETNIAIPEKITIDEDDLIVILGNLLDNAIEAVECMNTNNHKYIYLDFEYDKGSVWICVKNSYDNKINYDGERLLTRKGDTVLHGIGLHSVESVVKKYNGLIDIVPKQDFFVVDILLYL